MTIPAEHTENRPYIYVEFPKMKYHPEATYEECVVKARVVWSRDEELALGTDWYLTPAEALAALEAAKAETYRKDAEAKPPEPVTDYKQPGYKREAK
jgi:hypothetical protein